MTSTPSSWTLSPSRIGLLPADSPFHPVPTPAARPRATVLVVDDEEPLLKLVALCLEREGYAVLTAPNGEAALRVLEARPEPIDLLLTDWRMPGMGGEELLAHFRALHSAVPVLVMSSCAHEPDFGRRLVASGAGVLAKPFRAAELAARVREVLA